MIGLFAELGILFSLISLFVRQHIFCKLVFAVMPFGICAISLYLSKSASSVLTLGLTLAVIVGVAFITKLPRAIRMITLVGCTLIALLVTIVGTAYDAQKLVLKVSVKIVRLLDVLTYGWKATRAVWRHPSSVMVIRLSG